MALCEALRCKDEELQQVQLANQDLREAIKQSIRAIEYQHEHMKTLEGLITSQQYRMSIQALATYPMEGQYVPYACAS
jgi:hypothetical protein